MAADKEALRPIAYRESKLTPCEAVLGNMETPTETLDFSKNNYGHHVTRQQYKPGRLPLIFMVTLMLPPS